jgi:exopolysaccharide biosynthesis polyprenyl glycosylphosphotransferase
VTRAAVRPGEDTRTMPVLPWRRPAAASRGSAVTSTSRPADGGLEVVERTAELSWPRRYARRLAVTDLFALLWAATGVHVFHLNEISEKATGEPVSLPLFTMTAVVLVAWLVGLAVAGTRDRRVIGYGAQEYKRLGNATLAVFGVLAISSYLLKLELPRSYVVVMMPAGFVALLVSRWTWRRWLHVRRAAGENLAQVLAVGSIHTVRELVRDLNRVPQAGYRIVGACVRVPGKLREADGSRPTSIDGVPILGGLDDVLEVVRTSGADTVAVTATSAFGPSRVRKLSWELQDTEAELVLAPALTNIAGPRIHTRPVAGLPLIQVDRPTYGKANSILKRTFDVVVSGLLLLIAGLPMLVVAVVVKATSSGPVLFRQERVGINGTRFRMIKFRSMVVDAEARLAQLQAQQRDAGNEVLFKIKNDPRITPVGRFLRRYSLDELPQLLNVFTGDMSLVGPRPPLASEVELYEQEARRRLLVKPGITGLWQVSGRSDLTWDESVRLDVYYVENWSLTGDLVILWKTAKATVSSSGAY